MFPDFLTIPSRKPPTAIHIIKESKNEIVQIAKELLIILFSSCVMINVSLCTTKDSRVEPVSRPKTIVSSMGFNQQASDDNIMERSSELVLGCTENSQILDNDVYHDLEQKNDYTMVHGITCKYTPAKLAI